MYWAMHCFGGGIVGGFEGIQLAWQMGLKEVEINIDLVMTVNEIKMGKLKLPCGVPLVKQIRSLMRSSWQIDIIHVYREANRCADALANLRTTLDVSITMFVDCPIEFKERRFMMEILRICYSKTISSVISFLRA